jgi:hypothetical protein
MSLPKAKAARRRLLNSNLMIADPRPRQTRFAMAQKTVSDVSNSSPHQPLKIGPAIFIRAVRRGHQVLDSHH